CLGHVVFEQQMSSQATFHFQTVTRVDPNDAYAWYWLGVCLPEGSPGQQECLQRAVQLDPYLSRGLWALAVKLKAADPDRARALLAEAEHLRAAQWENDTGTSHGSYGDLGRYACVVGGPPTNTPVPRTGPLPFFTAAKDLQVVLRPGARWATAADFGSDLIGELRRRLRQRFGAALVCLDYNRDGRSDLFLAGAVVESGQLCDLLLRNDGGNRFTDVTNQVGLGGPRASL